MFLKWHSNWTQRFTPSMTSPPCTLQSLFGPFNMTSDCIRHFPLQFEVWMKFFLKKIWNKNARRPTLSWSGDDVCWQNSDCCNWWEMILNKTTRNPTKNKKSKYLNWAIRTGWNFRLFAFLLVTQTFYHLWDKSGMIIYLQHKCKSQFKITLIWLWQKSLAFWRSYIIWMSFWYVNLFDVTSLLMLKAANDIWYGERPKN